MSWYIDATDEVGLTGTVNAGETEEAALEMKTTHEALYPTHTFGAPYEATEAEMRVTLVCDKTCVSRRDGTAFIIRSDDTVREDV